jgi:ABC-type bacteriocin/lantibiotic exporter with double-glycine peptidase domain
MVNIIIAPVYKMENNIVYYLLNEFFKEEYFNIISMIFTSFFISIFQSNGISYVTANIIEFTQKKDYKTVTQFFYMFVLLSCIYVVLSSFYRYFQNKLLTKLKQWVKTKLLVMILATNNENLKYMNFSKFSGPINRISIIAFLFFTDFVNYLLPNLIFLLVIILYFLYKNIYFGVLIILGNLILATYVGLNISNMFKHNVLYEENITNTESMLTEILANFEKIISRGETKSEFEDYENKIKETIDSSYLFYENVNYHNIIMNIILFIILFLAVGYLIYLVFHHDLDLTTFITFFTLILLYRDKMISTIQQVPDFVEFIGRTSAILHYFSDLVDNYQSIKTNEYATLSLPFTEIRFENVSFQYPSTKQKILQDYSVELHVDHKIIGITGLSGKGKSTFAKLLLKLYQPDAGNIYINNMNIQDIDPDYLRQNIVYINQNMKLFDRKIIDNIYFACNYPEKCEANYKKIMAYPKIRELYQHVDMDKKEAGASGENLSGGQRQIVNIISGLINPSKILILDEPTNALDSELKKELLQIIREFAPEKTAIMIITHDKDCYSLFNQILSL